MLGTAAEALHHAAAHRAPAQRAHHLPELTRSGVGAPAGRFDSLQTIARALPKPPTGLSISPKRQELTPIRPNLPSVQMRELPVEHRANAVGNDHEIAVTEIAVDQRQLAGRTGVMVAQPAQRQFEHRPRPFKAAVVALEFGNLLGGPSCGAAPAIATTDRPWMPATTSPSCRANRVRQRQTSRRAEFCARWFRPRCAA